MSQVTLTMRDLKTVQVLTLLDERHMTGQQAAEELDLSRRQVWRKLKAFRARGAASVPHGNQRRKPPNALPGPLREHVVELAQSKYAAYNNHHLQEQLAENEGLHLSVASVRRLRQEAGLASPRKRRPPKHRSRREPKAQLGMMLQVDGSPHHWFGPHRPACSLLGAVDDATSSVCGATFRQEEDTVGYMRLLRQVIREHGIPLSLYSDRHSTFFVNENTQPTVEEQLRGEGPLTQLGRAAQELAIRLLRAHSAPAKGRVEKLFNTFQDRLIAEMATQGITDIEAANAFLPGFVERYNRRFAKAPADPTSAFRKAPPTADLDRILCLHFPRVVAKDHTITFGNRRLPVAPRSQTSYARKRILVRVSLRGQLSYWLGDQCLGKGPTAAGTLTTDPSQIARLLPPPPKPPAPKPTPPAPARRRRTPGPAVTPRPDHPWHKFRLGPARDPVLQSPRQAGG
jgi:transposase